MAMFLFAALDAGGEQHFIGDVDRGQACGCFCPECGSPLVAKQGIEKIWHFAHIGGQERPECEAGAMNMMHRLAIEHLKALTKIVLPRYHQTVTVASPMHRHEESVHWNAQPIMATNWATEPTRFAPVATLRLDNGLDVSLRVEIGDSPPRFYPPASGEGGTVMFWSTLPVLSDLRKKLYAMQHLSQHGKFLWQHQPDVFGLVAAARKRLGEKVEADDKAMQSERRRVARAAAQRWAAIARGVANPGYRDSNVTPFDQQAMAQSVGAPRPPASEPARYDWAPGRKTNSSFIFYRLKDGSAWVLYTVQGDSGAIAPWPLAEDGWDEALPASVGAADVEQTIYRVPSITHAMLYFRDRAAVVRTSSNPNDFDGL